MERRVLALRRELRQGDLGFVGAQAIQDVLRAERPDRRLPSLRTIGRILKRHGALDAVRRVRRMSPPAGWYLPDVAAGQAELDAFDVIEDLPLEGGPRLDALTTRALGVGVRRGVSPRCAPAGSVSGWKRTGDATAARPTPSSTTTRVSKERTPIRTCWDKSSGCAFRWASRRCLLPRANTDRKTSTKVSIICGSKKSGSVSTMPTRRPSKPAATASWRLTSNDERRGRIAHHPKAG